MKQAYIQFNIGKAKYAISFHNGISKHNDGSPFYDIRTFSNKKEAYQFLSKLQSDWYSIR